MRYHELNEAPINDIEVHHMDVPGTFPDVDRRLLQNPAHVQKIIKQFADSEYTFNLYFVNQPGVDYTYDSSDPGDDQNSPKRKERFFNSKFHADMEMSGIVTAKGMFDLFGIRVKADPPDAIGVVLISNANEIDSISMTPWMVAHRIAHSLTDNPGVNSHTEMLPDPYRNIPGLPGLSIVKCMTTRSARTNAMQLGEAHVEMIAQYLIQGWVNLVAPKGTTTITGRPAEVILQNLSNRIVRTIRLILDDCKGRILLAI